MIKSPRPSPTESPLLFEIDPEPLSERLTAWGGAALAVQALRSLGLPASIQRQVHIKQRERGYDEATMWKALWCSMRWVGNVWKISAICAGMEG